MKRRFAPLLLVGLSWTANPVSTEPTPDEANAAIETLGGGLMPPADGLRRGNCRLKQDFISLSILSLFN